MTPTVLLVNDIASVGGGQTVMVDVAVVLRDAGFEVHVASPPGELAVEVVRVGAQWHEFSFSQRRLLTERRRLPRPGAAIERLREATRLADLARQTGASVVHSGALVPHLDAALAKHRLSARVVWHINQVHPSYLYLAPLPDRVISVSQAALAPAGWRREIRRRSTVVPNGVDLEVFRPGSPEERSAMRSALDLDERFVVMTVARLEPLKGVDTVIRAAALAVEHPTIVVVGDSNGFSGGDAHARGLRSLAEELGVDVRFLGRRDDVPELLRAADVFALASRWEAFGLVLAEASASGLAVVTSNTGGCSEVVDPSAGVLLESDDVPGFAEAFDSLARDAHLRARMGRAGRELVRARFDKARYAERLLPHYVHLARTS